MASNITELKSTLFVTPVISTLCRYLSVLLLTLVGWRTVGEKPTIPKYVVVAAPHTSNWDFVLFVLLAFKLGFNAHWMGKHTLFPIPVRRLMVWLGGIPIDRSKAHNVVEQMSDYYSSVDELCVIIPPEGTRSKTQRWKTGFYHIAVAAKVPLVLGYIDSSSKSLGFGPVFNPTGDIEADLEAIQAFYKDKVGVVPDNY
ncbi:lysophospholipid acyltransferase family protein [Oceanicoccus sagamiensis]|uniref:Glycerol acyltransferase n=1 Tax=Oceanicoccus sagamiensis TaxID=716816 RepID=A0A1X9NMQ3_9GAMM|nr:lysophospholipid acyltransferase family protein [Oceanicoccus sagamiensis]ARN76067.1 glycerol acyltransferase [Oceanicoccus sagamiensis]